MELIKELFAIHSPSGKENRIRKYIHRWVSANVPGSIVNIDTFGNMYITKGIAENYPCVVAHLDQVQRKYPSDYKIHETMDVIFAFSKSQRSYCGLGGDDKCGIWIALKCLAEFDNIKVAFFPGEEIGCQGSRVADMGFFADTMYIIEPDRRGAHDLITEIGTSICSDEFIEAIKPELYGYKPTRGLMTDVEELKNRGYPNSCINLSCGYYEPHTDNEYVVKTDLLNALGFVKNIIRTVDKVYPHDVVYDDYGLTDDEELYGILDWFNYDMINADLSAEAIYDEVKHWISMPKERALEIIYNWKSDVLNGSKWGD